MTAGYTDCRLRLQVKLDYGLPDSVPAQDSPAVERLLVVCSVTARDSLLTAAGLIKPQAIDSDQPSAQDAVAEASLTCIQVPGGLKCMAKRPLVLNAVPYARTCGK